MDCPTCLNLFTEVWEGSESAEAVAARAHLELCPSCRQNYADFTAAVNALRALPEVAPPPRMLASIGHALDAATPQPRAWLTYWQPLAAGLSLAACCLMLLWAFVMHPVNLPESLSSLPTPHIAHTSPTPTPAPAATSPAPTGQKPADTSTPEAKPAARVRRGVLGAWGSWARHGREDLAVQPPGATTTSHGPQADTFATGDSSTVRSGRALNRHAGSVQMAFMPPSDRTVGAAVYGQLTLTGDAEANVTVTVAPRGRLQVANAPGGLLYQGPLRAGQALRLPVRLVAGRAGTQRLAVRMRSDVPTVLADLDVTIPSFRGQMSDPGQSVVTLTFRDASVRKAMRQMADQAGARLLVDDTVGTELVSHDYSAGVPFEAALRIMAESCGYRVTLRDGVYHVGK
jgi:hypothetical protein